MDQPAPVQILTELAHGHIAARCLHLIADFGVADALGDRPATAAELAARTGTNADALDRMLRLLAAHGVFAHGPAGYVHTPASRLLRGTDGGQSLRSYVRMIGMPVIWRGFTDLGHAAKTGGPATDWASLVAYFAEHPDESSLFNEAMTGKSLAVVPAVVAAYDFKRFGTVADIGGGRGHLLRAILDNAPNASGVLFELPHVIADARAVASSRLRLMAGDFFTDPLPAADVYVLMEVIHDWADADAKSILGAVRRAAPQHAHLLIVESLVSESPGPHFGKTLDIIMLAVTGGRERTRSEYEGLLAATGFHLERIIATPTRYDIVEAVAV
ncbi:MAG TPA: methyltransferase [Gammaproteobacteria bacterium]|nr:methyltransferase [Gammaproteobacteria bacterium]